MTLVEIDLYIKNQNYCEKYYPSDLKDFSRKHSLLYSFYKSNLPYWMTIEKLEAFFFMTIIYLVNHNKYIQYVLLFTLLIINIFTVTYYQPFINTNNNSLDLLIKNSDADQYLKAEGK